MGIIKGIVALWRIAMWFRTEKRKMEADIDGYLTQERALEWRLKAEKIFHALEVGKMGNIPRPVKWFFEQTTADERIGKFGEWFLKSSKLKAGNTLPDQEALNQPLYRAY